MILANDIPLAEPLHIDKESQPGRSVHPQFRMNPVYDGGDSKSGQGCVCRRVPVDHILMLF